MFPACARDITYQEILMNRKLLDVLRRIAPEAVLPAKL